MRTTVDIPDSIYRDLKVRAATEGVTIKQIILDSLASNMRTGDSSEAKKRPQFPVLRATNPGALQLGEEGVYEYIPFP
jgi:hypothetical protein